MGGSLQYYMCVFVLNGGCLIKGVKLDQFPANIDVHEVFNTKSRNAPWCGVYCGDVLQGIMNVSCGSRIMNGML